MQHHNTQRRRNRHMRAYTLGLRERLEETNHLVLNNIIKIQNEPDQATRITPIIRHATRRAQRIQALLDATTHAQ